MGVRSEDANGGGTPSRWQYSVLKSFKIMVLMIVIAVLFYAVNKRYDNKYAKEKGGYNFSSNIPDSEHLSNSSITPKHITNNMTLLDLFLNTSTLDMKSCLNMCKTVLPRCAAFSYSEKQKRCLLHEMKKDGSALDGMVLEEEYQTYQIVKRGKKNK